MTRNHNCLTQWEAYDMKHHTGPIALRTAKAIVALAMLASTITVFSDATAQENAFGPPDVLLPRNLGLCCVRWLLARTAPANNAMRATCEDASA